MKKSVRIIGGFDVGTGMGNHGLAFLRTLRGADLNLEAVVTYGNADATTLRKPDGIRVITRYSSCAKKSVDFAVFCDVLVNNPLDRSYTLTDNARVRIAYSVFESNRIPPYWVEVLNKNFDIALVPSDFIRNVFLDSGVKIDVITLPMVIDYKITARLDELDKNKPMTYGMIGGRQKDRKNIPLLLDAFNEAFADDRVRLRLHLSTPPHDEKDDLIQFVDKHSSDRVHITYGTMSDADYAALLREIDCFVSLSAAEGFSVIPREFMMLGKPVVLSDTSAHSDIPKMDGIYFIPAEIARPAHYWHIDGNYYGVEMSPYIQDVVRVLRQLAPELSKRKYYPALRAYARGFTADALRGSYSNVFAPKAIARSPQSAVTGEGLRLANKNVIDKYRRILGDGVKFGRASEPIAETQRVGDKIKRQTRPRFANQVEENAYLREKATFLEAHAAALADGYTKSGEAELMPSVPLLYVLKQSLPRGLIGVIRYFYLRARLMRSKMGRKIRHG